MASRIIHFIDTETTGLSPYKHEIISVGVVDVDRDTLEIIAESEYKLHPEHLELADPVALRVNKYNSDDWQDAMSQIEGLRAVREHLVNIFDGEQQADRSVIGGHNVFFDVAFINQSSLRHKLGEYLPHSLVDTQNLAKVLLRSSALKSVALPVLCEYFNIDNERPHTALCDARASFEVYKKLLEL